MFFKTFLMASYGCMSIRDKGGNEQVTPNQIFHTFIYLFIYKFTLNMQGG
jgi:hypothetical protein